MFIAIGVVVGVIILLLIIFPVVRDTTIHSMTLKKYEASLFDLPTPPHTTETGRDSQVGLQAANGNHCDYRATRYFTTSLSKEDILSYYSGIELPAAEGDGKIKPDIQFEDQADDDQEASRTFSIEIMDDGYDAGFDIRCA